MYQRVAADITETSLRGQILSVIAIISISTLFFAETKAYFSTKLETDLSLHNNINNDDEEQRILLNFDITMMDLPCEQATVDVFSTVGHQKNITKNIRKYPVDVNGVRQQYEARNWHQDDVELWDPSVPQPIEELHEDGEDAIVLDAKSFPFALKRFPYLFVNFYTDDCMNCDDLGPTWEALGEVSTDSGMQLLDEYMTENDIPDEYSDDEYEEAVNDVSPVLITKLNCKDYPTTCDEQNIRVYPTMRIFVDGEAKGDYNGHRTVMELVHWLSHMEAENREPGMLRMKHVLKRAHERTVRNEDEEQWADSLTNYRSPWGSWNVTRHPGCRLVGHVDVDKAPGKFLIHAQSYGHDIAAHMTNLSHIVDHFSFGDQDAIRSIEEQSLSGLPLGFGKSLHPMDDNVYVTRHLHQAYHHHLRVITAEFSGEGKVFKWARDKVRRVYRILPVTQVSTYRKHIVPEAKFSYDLSPIAVSYLVESRHWYDYLTGVLAIVGGAFAVFGMMDSGLSSLTTRKTSSYHY